MTDLALETCPKCGYSRATDSQECPACGIVFARYRARREESGAEGWVALEAAESGSELPRTTGELNPYAAPRAPVFLRRASDERPLATRGSRLGARFVDGILVVGALLPLLVGPAFGSAEAGNIGIALMVLGLLALAVTNIYFLRRDGQTLGKKAFKVRIVGLDGEKAPLSRLLILRVFAPNLLGAVPLVGPIFAIVNILFIFGTEQRCLHDYFASTKVVVA